MNVFPRERSRRRVQVCAALYIIFCAQHVAAGTAQAKPTLVSLSTSTRAVALDAVTFTPEPFSPRPVFFLYGSDRPTSIMLFVLNLPLSAGEDASALTADAEDAAHRHYNLEVEYVGKVPGQEWLSQVNLRLDGDMGDVGDVLVGINHQGVNSNRVRVGIGHVGGGPEDDAGAVATPAPPYTISGRIMSGERGLGGVTVTLGGAQTGVVTTGDDGGYSFPITSVGDYKVTPSKNFHSFTPPDKSFDNLDGNRTADFSATPTAYTVGGVAKDDEGEGISGLPLTLSGSGDSAPRMVITSQGGSFVFTNVVAGRGYTITSPDTSIFTFTQSNVGELDGDVTLTFNGTRRRYSIIGVVADSSGQGLRGVNVSISGALGMSTTTDANGVYSFGNLPAGKLYTVTADKTVYVANPESRSYNLSRDERADFTVVIGYRVNGRVVDGNGKGIYGIEMRLRGAEATGVYTALDGSYSFAVTTGGDYSITPFKEQDAYQFSPPSQSFRASSGNRTFNFTATPVIPSPVHVLEFDGQPMSVDYGIFWPQDMPVGKFFWEFWAMPGENTQGRYILSDGYGGTHTLLFGFNYGPRGYSLFGNIWNGTQPFYFDSDEGPSVGEWGHYAVGWDGRNIMTYYDGVPVGKTPFAGPRVSTGTGWGATLLLIGGSTHQNLIGRIAQVRGYEENNPRESSPESSFAPQTVFSAEGQLMSRYFQPAERVADLSYGYGGAPHVGWPRGMRDFYFNYSCPGCPVPQFVVDPTAPDFSNPANPGRAKTLVLGPPPTPGGALVFDSFSRDNSTYILGGKGGLGATVEGTAGPKTWQTGVATEQPQPFGILGGRAVLLTDDEALAWVSTGAGGTNLDVRVERTAGANGSGVNTGLCFRVVDKSNFFFAYTTDDEANPSAPKRLTLGYYLSGARTILANAVALPQSNWKTLRVVTTRTGAINVYADNALAYSVNNSVHAPATGAGLYNYAAGMGLSNRWDNFAVFELP